MGQLTRNQASVKKHSAANWKGLKNPPIIQSPLFICVTMEHIWTCGEKESSGNDIEVFLTNTTTKESLKIIPGEKISTQWFSLPFFFFLRRWQQGVSPCSIFQLVFWRVLLWYHSLHKKNSNLFLWKCWTHYPNEQMSWSWESHRKMKVAMCHDLGNFLWTLKYSLV